MPRQLLLFFLSAGFNGLSMSPTGLLHVGQTLLISLSAAPTAALAVLDVLVAGEVTRRLEADEKRLVLKLSTKRDQHPHSDHQLAHWYLMPQKARAGIFNLF